MTKEDFDKLVGNINEKKTSMTNAEIGIPEYSIRKVPKKKKPYKKSQSLYDLDIAYQTWWYSNKHIEGSLQVKSGFSDNKANDLQKAIQAWYFMNGGYATRRNTQGTYSVALGKYIRSGATNGAEDVDGTLKGLNVKVEVKIGSDKQRPAQIAYQAQIERAGGKYIIVKCFDSFLEQAKIIYNL